MLACPDAQAKQSEGGFFYLKLEVSVAACVANLGKYERVVFREPFRGTRQDLSKGKTINPGSDESSHDDFGNRANTMNNCRGQTAGEFPWQSSTTCG